ncbi:lens fiber membrane intrinsic protein-like [Anolis sagrei]|uniref:lens fiber membrane intrinsic protein n=1 Tax=Anolis sagrei TaxID=38937 RepID=UPI00295A673B|nr:lens fiber membrane intrinsic protein [Anolis sagrei ordinatus]
MHILQICATVCCFISLLLLLIALGTDYWVEDSSKHEGLWKNCTLSNCYDIQDPTDKLNASRAFMILGMISGAVSLLSLFATCFQTHFYSFSLAKLAAISSLFAGIAAMIAMSIYTSEHSNYGWSFGVGWASFPLFLITGGLAYVFHTSTAN